MPDDKIKISALPSALAFNNTDEMAIVQDNGGSKITKKGTVQGLGSHIVETMNFSSELDTDSNSIIGAINEAASDKNLAEPYSNTSFYIPGQYCIYNTVLYKCTTAAAFEDFDPTKWDEVLITEELGGDVSSKMDKANPTGTGSLAVGSSVSASGNNSTALGTSNTASGDDSHAEGFVTTASGLAAHAENDHTTASGASSHAEGYGTIANHASQHVFGECNVADPSSAAATARGNFVEIVGNGANTNDRSNARTLSWDGTETLAADLVFNNATTPQRLTSELQNRYTKAQVDAIIDSILPTDSASGPIANFYTSLEMPIKSLEVDVNAVQESGTPTPSTPKAISGWNAITLDVNGTTEVINLGGTYYGGHFTQDKAGHRQFEVTHEITDLGDISYSYKSTYSLFIAYLPAAKRTASGKGLYCLCTCFSSNYDIVWSGWANFPNYSVSCGCNYDTSINLVIKDTDYTDATAFKNAMSGVKLVYELATPYVIDLPDGEPIIAFNGTNNIYADSGDTAVSFKCSVEDYVNAHAGSGNRSLGVSLSKGAGNGEDPEELDEKTLIDDEEESGEIKPISKK